MDLILGAVVSLIVQLIKKYLKTQEWVTLLTVLVLSILASIGYSLFTAYGLWDKVYPVLITAGAIYTFIIRRFESKI